MAVTMGVPVMVMMTLMVMLLSVHPEAYEADRRPVNAREASHGCLTGTSSPRLPFLRAAMIVHR